MSSKIVFSILLISILNEACHAERLLGCTKFSDKSLSSSPLGADEIEVIVTSNPSSDVNYVVTADVYDSKQQILILDSCEKGAIAQDVISNTTLMEKAKEYKNQAKIIRYDFGSMKNNCVEITDIKSKIEKSLFPSTVPTLYVDLEKNVTTPTKRAFKRLAPDGFLLLDDCKVNSGDWKVRTEVKEVVQVMAKGVQNATKIEFPSANPCLEISKVAKIILDKLKQRFPTHTKVKEIADPSTMNIQGTHVRYMNGEFSTANDCTTSTATRLITATDIENFLDKVINAEMEEITKALKI